jgi:hypothetical protein
MISKEQEKTFNRIVVNLSEDGLLEYIFDMIPDDIKKDIIIEYGEEYGY